MEELPALVLFGVVIGSRKDRVGSTAWLRDLVPELDDAYGDQRLAPFDFTQGDELQGLLVAEADSPAASYFRRTSEFRGFDRVFTGKATALGMIALPASLYVAGLARKDSKMKSTVLLAGEAVLDSELLTIAAKDIDRRLYPASIPAPQGFTDTWFKTKGDWLRGSGSFPSGHTIAAFSIGTVIARRYGNHRWVPYAAYGAAALVGFSRLPLMSHYVSDVFMGSALGYSIARFAVLR